MYKGVYFLSATRTLLILLMFLMPLFFVPVTLDPLEINKQTLLLVLTCASALCWLAHMLLSRQVTLRKGWVNFLPCVLVLAFLVPAFYSVAPFLSWVGAHRSEYTSVLTVVLLAILFYLLGNTMGSRQEHRRVHLALIISTSLAGFIFVLQILGGNVFGVLPTSIPYNTIGTLSSFATFLIVLHGFFLAALLSHNKGDSMLFENTTGIIEQILIFFVSFVTFFLLLLLDDSGLWILFSLSLGILCVFVVFHAKDFPHHGRLIIPGVLFFGSLVCWFVFPGLSLFGVPQEVTPNTTGSLLVASQTLSTYSNSWGSGPGTYVFDYNQFHDVSVNETPLWDVRFDRASSFVLTLVPTIGVFGVTMLLVFVFLLSVRSITQILKPASREEWLESFVHFAPWLTLVMSSFFVAWNMTLVVAFGVFSGLLASQVMRESWSKSFPKSPAIALCISSVFVLFVGVFFVGMFLTGERYAAEVAFTRSVHLASEEGNVTEIVRLLDRATSLNPTHDTYHRNLGEALLLRVGEELQGVDSIDSLTPEATQNVQSTVADSVENVVRATELSPNNVLNWLSRGFVYRELIPLVSEASEFAVASYRRATELEPVNPVNWTELGRTYLRVAEHLRSRTQDLNTLADQQTQTQITQSLANAQQAFETAIQLKPTYAPAHFQLAMVYERQGRIDDAVGKMERIAQYNPLDVGVFFQLGMLYLQRGGAGDTGRAKAAFESAIKIAPGYANAHWYLASLYEFEGNIDAAVSEVKTVLELDPGNDLVEARLQRLLTGQISTEVPEAIEE